jgi:hypothetical protein
MPDVAINWSSAEVTAFRGALQLEVLLDSEPDKFWESEFAQLRDSHQRRIGGSGERWWAKSPSLGKLTVGYIEPGTERSVRHRLDEMVVQANEAATRARAVSVRKRQVDEKAAEEWEKAAREMTKRFRRGP